MWSLSGVERRQPHELIAICYPLKSNIHSSSRQPLNTADAIRRDSFTKKSIKSLSCPDSRVLNVKDGRAWPLWRHVVHKEMGTLKTRQVLRTTGSKGTTYRRSILGRLRYRSTSCNTGKGKQQGSQQQL